MQGKKQEYRDLKLKYANDRKRCEREARELEKLNNKGGMQKKISFLPALHPRDEGFKFETGLAIGDVYVNYRERLKLCVPDRAFLKEDPLKNWKLGNRNGSIFKKDVRQELDDYDFDYRKYMTTWERGIDNPRKTDKIYLNSFDKQTISPT